MKTLFLSNLKASDRDSQAQTDLEEKLKLKDDHLLSCISIKSCSFMVTLVHSNRRIHPKQVIGPGLEFCIDFITDVTSVFQLLSATFLLSVPLYEHCGTLITIPHNNGMKKVKAKASFINTFIRLIHSS